MGRTIVPGDQSTYPFNLKSQEIQRDAEFLSSIIANEDIRRGDTSTGEMFIRGAGGYASQMASAYISRFVLAFSSLGLGANETTQQQAQAGTLGESNASDVGILAGATAIGAVEAAPLDFALRGAVSRIKDSKVRRTIAANVTGAVEWLSEVAGNGMLYLESQLFTSQEDPQWQSLTPAQAAMSYLLGSAAGVTGQMTSGGMEGAHKDQIATMKAMAEGASLDKVAKVSQESDLRKTRPESYRRFLQKSGADETQVHIDGPEAKEFLAEKSTDEIEQDQGLQRLQRALGERDTAEQDVTITLTDYLTEVAASKDYQNIRGHARTKPDTDSLNRRRKKYEEDQEFVDELSSLAENDEKARKHLEQTRKVEDMLYKQITQSGVVDPKAARSMAQTSAARFSKMASERDMSPTALFRQQGLSTEGPASARKQGGTLNIELGTAEQGDPDQVVEMLESEGVQVSGQALRGGNTLVVDTAEPVDQEQGDRIAESLGQDSVTQMTGGNGQVFGPNQQGVEFDADQFLTTNTPSEQETIDPTDGILASEADSIGQQDTSQVTAQLIDPEQEGAYTRTRSGNVSVAGRQQPLRGATLYDPSEQTQRDVGATSVVEMPDSQTGAQTFLNAVKEARRQDPAVSVQSKSDYAQMRLFIAQDGSAGAAVKSDGEIVSRFGSDTSVLLVALQNDGSWLSAYETSTIEKYKDLGFFVAGRTEWNPEQKPRDWKTSERGKPSTLFMVHRPTGASGLTRSGETTFSGREEAVEQVNSILEKRSRWLEGSRTLDQEARADFTPDQNLIRLFENADATSWMHEFSHFMKTVEDAQNSQASEDIKAWHSRNADALATEAGVSTQAVQSFLENGSTGDRLADDRIDTAMQEQFARAWETYLMEGRAPSAGLRDAFRTFSSRFKELYRNVQGNLGVPMDDGIRDTFDRMLASAEQIDEVAQSEQYRALLTDATVAGMTESQWEQYQNHVQNVRDQAAESIREQLFKKLRRRESRKWKEERQSIKDELLPDIENNKVNTARRALRGERKMDRSAVKDIIGEITVKTKRGKQQTRLHPKLDDMTQTGSVALTPNQAAATLNYDSGAEMLQDIIKSSTAEQEAEQRAAETMEERHGGDLDTNVEAMVDRAMENEAHAQVLLDELKALDKPKGESQRTQIRQLARDKIAQKSYRELNPESYRSAEVRSAKAAQKAWDKGDRETAGRAKNEQLINHYLAIEAQAAKERIESRVDRLNRYRRKSTREAIQASRGGHWEQIERMLGRFEFRKSASLKSVDQFNESLAEWSQNRITTYGDALEIPPELMREDFVTHWKNIPLNQLEGVLGTIENIEHVARRSATVIQNDKRVSHEETIAEIQRRLADLPQKFKSKRTDSVDRRRKGGKRKGAREYVADQTKPQWLFSWMDQNERVGFFHSIFTDPMNKSFKEWQDMLIEHQEPVLQLFENMSNEGKKKRVREYYFEGLPNEDKTFYGENIIMVALNVGNKENLEKLIIGEGWGSRDNPDSLTIDNPYLQEVLAPLGKEEMDMVQNVWDRMEALYPSLKQTYENATDKPLAGVTPQEVEMSFGTYRGGYFPAVVDRDRAETTQTEPEAPIADSMFTPNDIRQIGVTTDATHKRTQATYPMKLSFDVVTDHFADTIHYIAYHDTIRSINQILQDPRFRKSFTEVYGEDEFAHLKPWLQSVATKGKQTEKGRGWARALRHMRLGVTYGFLGYSYSTGISQFLGLSNATAEVGSRNMARAVEAVGKDMAQLENAMTFAQDNSDLMAHRIKVFDRDAGESLERLDQQVGKTGKYRKGWRETQKAGLKAIGLTQLYGVDIFTWYGGYFQEMEKTGDEDRAFKRADLALENVQGSGRIESQSAVMRDQREETRMLTLFMTFFSARWNAQRDLYEGGRTKQYGASDIAARLLFMLAFPAIADMYLRGNLLPDEEEDETEEGQAAKVAARVALEPLASVPFFRAASSVAQGFDYSLTPVGDLYGDMVSVVGDLAQTAADEDKDVSKSLAKTTFYTGGALLHIPGTHQMWGTAEHLWQVMEEGEDLTFQELTRGSEREQD